MNFLSRENLVFELSPNLNNFIGKKENGEPASTNSPLC